MPFLLAFWKPIVCVLALVALMATIAITKHHYDEARRDEGRAEVQAKWDADKAARIKRTTELTLLLSGKLQEAKDETDKAKRASVAAFVRPKDLAGRVASGPGVRMGGDLIGVLDAAASAANSQRPDAGTTARTDTVSASAEAKTYDERELADYFVRGAEAYADAYGLLKSCYKREDAYLATMQQAKGDP